MKITNQAYDRIGKVLSEPDMPENAKLRVYVKGGGCSGFQYGFEIAEDIGDGDEVYEKDGIEVLIDPMSFMYLNEATLDFKSGLDGEMFTFSNPAAQTTCGCGSSFSA